MIFRGKVLDQDGNPLMGANIVTLFDRTSTGRKAGTITDFDGVFVIGDARSDESWKISYVGFEDVIFNIPRNGGELKFVLKEKVFELNEVVVTPRTPGFNPDDIINPLNTNTDFANQFQNVLNGLKDKPKKSFLDTLRDNPLLAFVGGTTAILLLGLGLSKIAKVSDKKNQQLKAA